MLQAQCPYCGVGCGTLIQVENDRIVGISPDKLHPTNKGVQCIKGLNAHEPTYRDRLTKVTEPDPDGTGSLAAPVTEYDYDAASRLTDVTDPLDRVTASPWEAATVLTNVAVEIRYWQTEGRMNHLVRNADGDDCLFVHQGQGHLFCDYGHLEFRDGDYIVLPRGTAWRRATP